MDDRIGTHGTTATLAMSHAEQLHERRKRRVYLVTLAVALLVTLVLMGLQGLEDPVLRVVHPTTLLLVGAVLVATWRGLLSFRAIELVILGAGIALIMGALVLWRLGWTADQPLAQQTATLLWVTMLYPLAFVVLGKRGGLATSLAVLAGVAAIVGSAVASGAAAALPEGLGLLAANVGGLHAMLIALLWIMATRYETMLSARARAERLAREATTDPLTGLANRRALTDALDDQIAQARQTGAPLSVLSVDLDHFKRINDTWGHDAGDRALAAVGAMLAGCARAGDRVGRWGGEEFLLIAPGADAHGARALAERCRAAVAAQDLGGGERLTASLGVAALEPDEDRRALLRRADLSVYAAKAQGRDRVVGLAPVSTVPEDVEAADHEAVDEDDTDESVAADGSATAWQGPLHRAGGR